MNKREIGKKLEYYVSEKLSEVLDDNTIKPTKNSGASTQLGDVLCKDFLIECKKRNTSSITINEKVWNKLISKVPLGSIRIPLYVLENKNGKKWVCLYFDDFCNILKKVR